MSRAKPTAVIFAALCTGSAATARGYGESDEVGRPSHEERWVHVLTNQVRQAPHEWPGWDTSLATSVARPPVALQTGLLEAARFHAEDMAQHQFLAHESSDGTTFETRAARYFDGFAGENVLLGGVRDADAAITGWMNSDGHRSNMLTPSWTWLGTGYANVGPGHYYVQDFGQTRSAAIPRIPGGAVESRNGKIRLAANYFDATKHSPQRFEAVVADRCVPLERIVGAAGNETWGAQIEGDDDCAAVFFVAIDGDGQKATFPTRGSLRIGERCAREFDVEPQNDACAGGDQRPVIDADEAGGCRSFKTGTMEPAIMMLILIGCLRARAKARD